MFEALTEAVKGIVGSAISEDWGKFVESIFATIKGSLELGSSSSSILEPNLPEVPAEVPTETTGDVPAAE